MKGPSGEVRPARRGLLALGALALSLSLAVGGVLALASSGRESLPRSMPIPADPLMEAKVAFVDGDFARAEKILRTLSGNDARTLLGRVLLERGRCDEASRIFSAVLNEDAKNFEATCGLARTSQRMGQREMAAVYWARATELHKDDARAWRELALCQREKGDTLGALSSVQRALALDPNQADLTNLLTELTIARHDLTRLPEAAARTSAADPLHPRTPDPAGLVPLPRVPDPTQNFPRPSSRTR